MGRRERDAAALRGAGEPLAPKLLRGAWETAALEVGTAAGRRAWGENERCRTQKAWHGLLLPPLIHKPRRNV